MLAIDPDASNDGSCACSGSVGGTCCKQQSAPATATATVNEIESLKVIYSSLTGTAKTFAAELERQLVAEKNISIKQLQLVDITEYDNDDLLTETSVCVFLLSTYNVEGPLDWFTKWLRDLRYDWRVDRLALQKLRYSVCGLGDSAYGDEFNVAAQQIDKWLGQLGATRIYPLGACDKNSDQKAQFDEWCRQFINELQDKQSLEFSPAQVEYGSDVEEEEEESEESSGIDVDGTGSGDEMLDVEDMGKMAGKLRAAKVNREREEQEFETAQAKAKRTIGNDNESGENLTKQGYKIVGTHSGVKICRWTKSALRGRGFCYKHSFYGIQSHLCMETTPSLACANKCVFCWRHHTNPVGTKWRWKVDDPKFILDGAMENHYKMIKQLKGVPGVKADRFQEAFTIRHCALSLVGEPIFYPHINEFVKLLHEQNISSFLVTNAQFPDKIAEMELVTQLYVSIDAGTREGLKKIDRPLFRDFWERFLDSLEALADKGQRTVYRLTLVKDHNTEELDNYVELVRRGRPSFIEVKGVTYCGYSGASNLTMANVPYHHEVVDFCQKLCDKLGGGYELACEHAHSCSILIAQKDFKINGEWHTHIDYPKFFELVRSGKPFTSMDYVAKTPDWAVFGSDAGGFDPEETRFYRKNRKVVDANNTAGATTASTAAAAS
ncbi:hypothetical protein BDB00DRAFT_760609 [Zychaea mexicana]|uniref:uncharacterized protein n=1 Tax=Zychaea mexicana TaxID=64656 RepID=UPI0022FE85DD|nr:uncharacterized protein BDB00DRAFT_760609 [Zychaea mexicana]KAI9495231.1 hypothetical protein BDB00DRAFT_760609 [Zychaea mexicana]